MSGTRAALITALAGIGIAVVAVADYLAGDEIMLRALYLLPLALAAWYLSRGAAVLAALAALVAWCATLWLGDALWNEPLAWLVNVSLQAIAFVVFALLVRQLREAQETQRTLASTDSTTGLANSRSFFERAGSVIAVCHRNGQGATLAFIELAGADHGAFSHHRAEPALRKVADVLSEHLRSSDIAARLGGGEFAILLPDTDELTAHMALEKVRQRLDRAEELLSNDIRASIGAVSCTPAPPDLARMLRAAERVITRAKAGGNHVIVQGMDAAASERQTLYH